MYTYYINVKDVNNPHYPCIDGDNYWIKADTAKEAKEALIARESLYHHDLTVYDRKKA